MSHRSIKHIHYINRSMVKIQNRFSSSWYRGVHNFGNPCISAYRKETCEFPCKITIVAWGHLYDYVEKSRTRCVAHQRIFAFLFKHYQSFSQWQSNCPENNESLSLENLQEESCSFGGSLGRTKHLPI